MSEIFTMKQLIFEKEDYGVFVEDRDPWCVFFADQTSSSKNIRTVHNIECRSNYVMQQNFK